ncbi:serine-rich adhesin for platelets isoform X2 [Malaya genurostris]|uniref:serine-rich adhesin for platelets isoform X2 n=1 Tax=Malaya genurostris TaxID=325434 RepID=UPI0026F3B6B7|nr:serine-rich adhesin for platelets isoform X2 [Malaya genurostris]
MGTLTSSSTTATFPAPKSKVCSTCHEEEPSEARPPTTSAVATTASTTSTMERNSRTDASGRSAALERAYVHDVYEHCEEPIGQVRPKVAQFLAGLEPGSVVCDVGCGNGRYLSGFNPTICTIGVDRCYRLTKVAHGKGSEVAICDNLELPFRDESFDAVLSLAVVHHFATTERRVGAIRELARILRIGGRVIITVWALEQRHRRFESQDVLVPWQPPRSKNTAISDEEDDDDFLPPYHAYTEDSTNSSRSAGDGDSSSLSSSSPGETCYSFVRRAIQKLAGSKKSPWFLESWSSRETKHDSSLDYEDAKDLPIELRRLEDFDDLPEPPLSAGLKSRSLGSILNPPPKTIVRSRSSVPSLGAQIPELKATPAEPAVSRRPRLVKQKQSLCDDIDHKLNDSAEAYQEHILRNESRIQLLRKQSSLNEELMAESRLREKDRIRKRIQKQMSLNESFLCRSLFTKRLQVIKEGFTTKLKTSTGSLERVTKNGFVKIMQNIKATAQAHHSNNYAHNRSYDSYVPGYSPHGYDGRPGGHPLSRNNSMNNHSGCSGNGTDKLGGMGSSQDDSKPRRHSRESGSDSSKDSSLQSDTSIESEDSFASVIYIPKPDVQQQTNGSGDGYCPGAPRIPSGPTSPLVMPCPTPAHSPAPPRTMLNSVNGKSGAGELSKFTFEDAPLLHKTSEASATPSSTSSSSSTPVQSSSSSNNKLLKSPPSTAFACTNSTTTTASSSSSKNIVSSSNSNNNGDGNGSKSTTTAKPPVQKITRQQIKDLPPIPKFRKSGNYPILRRQSSTNVAAPVVPKLLSLELFNPETDDLDSDSSEPSSPDSIDSVISALKPSVLPQPAGVQQSSQLVGSSIPPLVEAAAVVAHKLEDAVELVIRESETKPKLMNGLSDSRSSILDPDPDDTACRQHLVDFAEKLSAQLLKELDNEKHHNEEGSFEDDEDDVFNDRKFNNKQTLSLADAQPYLKKLNGDLRDLHQLRAELRERRLMLANLSHLGCSGLGGSNDSLGHSYGSSMTPIIQEESDDEELIELEHDDYDSCIGSRGPKTSHVKSDEFVIIPELDEDIAEMTNDTALLIQEEDSSEEHLQNIDIEHLNISNSNNNNTNDSHLPNSSHNLSLKTVNLSSAQLGVHTGNFKRRGENDGHSSTVNNGSQCVTNQRGSTLGAALVGATKETSSSKKMPSTNKSSIESHASADSWAHSNSSASLDSPSAGGSATHHRYYHVFREGELDALINHHVTSLHIVSSYYERASWCVVAEKVQVWTI